MKAVENLFHFTKDIKSIYNILDSGFMPSYAMERLRGEEIFVPMVSFSNIQLRDVGAEEVLSYGDFAICFNRQWGVEKGLNPVVYSYPDGIIDKAIDTFLNNSIFLARLTNYKDMLIDLNKTGQTFSDIVRFEGVSNEALRIMNFLARNYNEELLEAVAEYSEAVANETMPIIQLAKSFKVTNAKGKEFIAYNDREWRKIYPELGFMFREDFEKSEWFGTEKPHLRTEQFRLRYNIDEVKAILLESNEQIGPLIDHLKANFGPDLIDELISTDAMKIGTMHDLLEAGF